MAKFVVYNEMANDGKNTMEMRLSVEAAIYKQKQSALKSHNYIYKSDLEALEDFLADNWAQIEEE